MKILFTTYDYSALVRLDALTRLEDEVGKLAECKWSRKHKIKEEESRHHVAMRVMPDADWVYHSGLGYRPPKNRKYKISLLMTDLHCSRSLKLSPQGIVKRLNKNPFDAYLMQYTKLAYQAMPEMKPIEHDYYLKHLKGPKFHLAPSVSPEIYKPSDKPKLYGVAFLAHASKGTHPFRYEIKCGLPQLAKENKWRVIMRDRPPGKSGKRYKNKMLREGYIVGPKYVETVSRSKIFIFGLGRFKYPAARFMEGMACRTCVMSDPPLTAEEVHFIPDWNFVNINSSNWKQKLKYYMTHKEEREEIARNGYETFLKYHTHKVRAEQLVKFYGEHL